MRKTRNFILIKTLRVGGWTLLALVIGFLISGYTMTGRFHFGRLTGAEQAKQFHLFLHWPLLLVVVAHAIPAVYFAWLRWTKRRHRR